ncbi:MAG: nitronate monooxygenase [Gemmatimonadota bacterium]|nr:nitronate monooxygenase [Gemmatimonadota bacterium]
MTTPLVDTPLARDAGVAVPLICGPMYPCSNPELVGAVSRAGGLGAIQPAALTFVHGYEFRAGVRHTLDLAGGMPVGMNALIEGSNRRYRERMEQWIEIALEEGVRFFITSLGKPRWVVDRVAAVGGRVYHDVTERKWALKAVDSGVHGLIAVNRRAGGHAGPLDVRALLDDVGDLGLPVVCAGGIATAEGFAEALAMGYAGVQMGTRFIATTECTAGAPYKEAILAARADDVVLTERLTGVPVAVLNTPYVQRMGLRAGPLARRLLRGSRTKHWMRALYALRSAWSLRKTAMDPRGRTAYWQAGKSVEDITDIVPAGEVVEACARAAAAPRQRTESDSTEKPA